MSLSGMTAAFAAAPLEFLRSVSIEPPSAGVGLRKSETIKLKELSIGAFSKQKEVSEALPNLRNRFRSSYPEVPIGWIEFESSKVLPNGVTFSIEFAAQKENPSDYTDVSNDFEERVESQERLPVFYLPWKPDHFMRLSLPRYRIENTMDFGAGVWIDPYCPHIFFTAMLSGCSVFVHGDPRQPTVVHVGTKTRTPYGEDSPLFWRELLTLERKKRLQQVGSAYEVDLTDYMEGGETGATRRFLQWVGNQSDRFELRHTVRFGAVFGIRYGSLWSFYLQENAMAQRIKIERKNQSYQVEKATIIPFFKTTETKTRVVVSRKEEWTAFPLAVRPFFPTGGGQAQVWDTFQRTFV